LPHETPADLRSPEQSVALPWDAVRTFLATRGLALDADPPPRQFAGGLANLNYLIHLGGKPYVLRRPPMGDLPAGSHDMAREHRILSRLPDALPFVPRSVLLCDDPAIIGQRFQILEYRPGLVIREHMPPDLAHRPDIGARLSQVLLETMISAAPKAFSRAPSPAGASAAGQRRKPAPTRCTRMSAPGWTSTACRMARRACCTTTSSSTT
jgi:aminoglycoside phosphotransferase (APT) family kinase protein